MKFLYLKGMNIFGPFEAEQIAKEESFSADLLVCPEDNAEQEAAWKPASAYEDFKDYLDRHVFHFEEKEQIVNENFVNTPKDSDSQNKNISQDLPALEDTSTETATAETDNFSFSGVMDELSGKEEDNQEEDIKDHTFHIANKEDNLLEDLPAHSLLNPEEKEDSSDKKTQQNTDDVQETNNVQGNKELFEISNNKIISSSDGRVKKRKSNDLLFILSFLVLMVVAIALCMAFWNVMNGNNDSETPSAVSENAEQASKPETESFFVPEVAPQQAAEPETKTNEISERPKTFSSEEQVINVVKNTKLNNNKGTIGNYLDKVYGKDYQTSWSAKPFTDKVYIVEFFASQVRNEPYVYLFRVDMDQKKITGALNNITLDLLA